MKALRLCRGEILTGLNEFEIKSAGYTAASRSTHIRLPRNPPRDALKRTFIMKRKAQAE